MRFAWDAQNRCHLARHGVSPEIAEAVFFSDDRQIEESIHGQGRYECEASHGGRWYRLVFTVLSEYELYPITCFPIRRRRP